MPSLRFSPNIGWKPTWMWSAWSAIDMVAPPMSNREMIWAGAIVPWRAISLRTETSVIPPGSWWPRIGMPLIREMSTALPDE